MWKFNNFLFLIFIFSLISCGKIKPEGEISSKDIKINVFFNLELSGNFHVFLVKSPENMVTVESYENIIDNVSVSNSGETLSIKEKRDTENVGFYSVTIYSKNNPREIKLLKASDFTVSGAIDTDKFKLDMEGNTVFIGAINSRSSVLSLKNKSRANLTGKSELAEIKITDTANFISPYWQIKTLSLSSENGNYCEVSAEDSIKGFVKNSAKLLYYNDPVRILKIDKTATVKNKVSQ